MDVKITKLNGESFKFSDYGITVQDFNVSSIPLITSYGNIEGRHGQIDNGATYGNRTITVPNFFRAYDLLDYPLMRDKLFELSHSLEPFYISEIRRATYNGNDNQLVNGKRYLVRLQNSFSLEQTIDYGFSDLTFETTNLPFAESIGTTQDIQRNGISSENSLWAYGMGLPAEDLQYTHKRKEFSIYNAGIALHPFEQELKIIISDVAGSSNYFELRNATNGATFKTNVPVASGQTIVLDGPRITMNSAAYLRNTNKQYIELSPGWNYFIISGADSAKVSFDFRFYYL